MQALGLPPPPEGWNNKNALAAVSREFGIEDIYGLNPNTPLCTEFFVNSLRQILTKVQQAPSAGGASPAEASRFAGGSRAPSASVPPPGGSRQPSPSEAVEAFISESRRNGMIGTDVCETVPAKGIVRPLMLAVHAEPARLPASSEAPPP